MFTGLVEETGKIVGLRRVRGSVVFTIRGKKTMRGLRVDHSIAVDGVCLTVIKASKAGFDVQAVEQTLRKTTLGSLESGSIVNLERPMRPTDRLGGHFVLGHVDGLGRVEEVETRGSSWYVWIRVPARFARYLIPVGSVAVNGISLTIAEVAGSRFAVSIIPHTMEVTDLKMVGKGDRVNVEFDMLGKYVERLMQGRKRGKRASG